jgi:mRNA interferase RelE/StbE
MPYDVEFSPAAMRELEKLPRDFQRDCVAAIECLQEEPRPHGCVKMRGQEQSYRIRVGDYRVVYDIYDRVLLVLVLRVRHRREVYKGELYGSALRSWIERKLSERK